MQTIVKSLLLSCIAIAVSTVCSAQNTFPPSGLVGIGTLNPQGALHIFGSTGRDGIALLILQRNAFPEWYVGFAENGSFALNARGKLPAFSVFQDGTIRLSSLGGTGTRMVVANDSGLLATRAIPGSSSGGDNLGNHTATTNLNMNSRDIINVNRIKFDGNPTVLQTSPSPWIYYNLPEGFIANYRFLIGQGNIDPAYKLKVEGDAYATGVWIPSDLRFKKNISIIQDPILKLKRLTGVTYDLNLSAGREGSYPVTRSSGLIAQELKEVLPEAVHQDMNGQYAVNYNAVTSLLVESIKQQQGTIERQQKQLDQLEKALSKITRPSRRK